MTLTVYGLVVDIVHGFDPPWSEVLLSKYAFESVGVIVKLVVVVDEATCKSYALVVTLPETESVPFCDNVPWDDVKFATGIDASSLNL